MAIRSNGAAARTAILAGSAVLSLSFALWPDTVLTVQPGMNIQSLVAASPPGSKFLLQPGVFRMQSISPKDGDAFEGLPGATLNGARLVTGFVPQDGYWVSSIQLPSSSSGAVPCLPSSPACGYANELFLGGTRLHRVDSLSRLTAGAWYPDYVSQRLVIADDPTGKTVELSTATFAFGGGAARVTLHGIVIEKYANLSQQGAVNATGSGWLIEGNEIRLNHGLGVRTGQSSTVRSNSIHDNGQLGIGGDGGNVLIAGNQVAHNNAAGFDYSGTNAEAGGIKIVKSTGLLVQNNHIHDNTGPGLWLDTDNYRWRVESNRLFRNMGSGVLLETGYDGVMRFNVLEKEGIPTDPSKNSLWWSAAVTVHTSSNTEIADNTLLDCGNGIAIVSTNRGSGMMGRYAAQNVYVHDNTIINASGIAAGLVADVSVDPSPYLSANNRFAGDRYLLKTPAAAIFTWYLGGSSYANVNYREWQQSGGDRNSALLTSDVLNAVMQFAPGNRVAADSPAEIYTLPSPNEAACGRVSHGDPGAITTIGGPIHSASGWWWNVQFDSGIRGWAPATVLTVAPSSASRHRRIAPRRVH